MGVFDWVGHSLDWIEKRWDEDWHDQRASFNEMKKTLPQLAVTGWNGQIALAQAPFKDDGDFWGATHQWLDDSLNTAKSLTGGTVGSIFSIPVLHEASWLLDKAYRYGIARPISSSFVFTTNSYREAYAQGANPTETLWDNMTDWKEIKKAWNDSEYVTPGQAIVYETSMAFRSIGDADGAMRWADEHDPRTPSGQMTFNSPEAEFWLKYTSGSLDMAGNVFADPGHGASVLTKFAKLRFVDKLADARYVNKGGVEREIGGRQFNKVYDLLIDKNTGKPTNLTKEEFRNLTMPAAARGAEIADLLWTSARMGKDVYRDTYLTVRAADVNAFRRLSETVPKLAADYADMYANFTIADFDFQRGGVQAAKGADALRKTKVGALVESFDAVEGLWGKSLGIGFREVMPKARVTSRLKAGYHSWVLNSAPIIIGRPMANVMPSQGWTPLINSGDTTGIGVKQFKANLERANTAARASDLMKGPRELIITPEEINKFTSHYGSATSDATRSAIAMHVDNLIVARVLKRWGMKPDELPHALNELNRNRYGTRKVVGYERLFMSNQARKSAERAAAQGNVDAAKNFERYSEELRKARENGTGADEFASFTDVDGRLNLVPLDTTMPVLRSQFRDAITMLDYRALNGALRWWKMTHPKPKSWIDPDDPAVMLRSDIPVWQAGLAKLAKARGLYDATITTADAASTLWKSSALFRPAQAPRNVASDWALMFAEFGKLPLLLSSANIIPNALRNFGPRGRLVWEMLGDGWARTRGRPPERVRVDVDATDPVEGNIGGDTKRNAPRYTSPTAAFADGFMPLAKYLRHLDVAFQIVVNPVSKRPNPFEEGKSSKASRPELFQATAAKQAVGQQVMDLGYLQRAAELTIENGGMSRKLLAEKLGVDAATAARLDHLLSDRGILDEEGELVATLEDLPRLLPAQRDLEGNRAERIDPTRIGSSEGVPSGKINVPPRLPRLPGDPEELQDFGRERTNAVPGGEKDTRDIDKGDDKPVDYGKLSDTYTDLTPAGGGSARGRKDIVAAPYSPWRAGAPMAAEYYWWRQWKDSAQTEADYTKYKQHIVDLALRASGKTKFAEGPWGKSVIKELITRHINKRQSPGYEDNPYAPGTLIVDPFTGLQPKDVANVHFQKLRDMYDISSEAVLETRNIPKKKRGSIGSVALGDVHKQLVRWIQDNADTLLIPDTLLALRVKPDGNISVGYATATATHVASGATVKAGSAWRRIRDDYRYTDIRDSAHTGHDYYDAKGNVIGSVDGWAQGDAGQSMMRSVSARDSGTAGYDDLVASVDMEARLETPGVWKSMRYGDREYAESWERSVNAHIASDPVAQMFLKRKRDGSYYTDSDVIAAVEDTAWGTKWIKAMGFRGVAYVDQIRQIEAMIKTYAPHPDDPAMAAKVPEAHKLRADVLAKRATYQDFEKLYRSVENGKPVFHSDLMPEVHGQSVENVLGLGRQWKYTREKIRVLQRLISDMPVDKWARFPFMSMAYQRHGVELAKVAGQYFDGPLPAKAVQHIKTLAVEKAYHDVRYRLYDTAQRNDFAYATRLFMPFSAAMMDSYIKYGRVLRENPMLLVQGAYYWDTFERNGMVQDEEGNVAEYGAGKTSFYKVDPTSGERTLVPDNKVGQHRYVQFQLPSSLAHVVGKNYYGVDAAPVIAVNKETMNVFLNTPGGGPLVAFPANEFALHNPEFGENEMIRKYVLPYGPTASRGKTFLPSTVRSAWDAFVDRDGDTAGGHAAAIMQAELIGYGLHTRNAPPTFEEVREKAAGLAFLRFASTFASPASFQLQSPYQPYVSAYRQMLADPETAPHAAEQFMKLHGDEFYAVQMSVTRNNAGLSATLESSAQYDKYADLIGKYPDFGGLIVGADGVGAFAKSVYEAQKDTPVGPGDSRTIRQLMSLSDSVKNLQMKTVWSKYSQLMNLQTAALVDRGVPSYKWRASHDLSAAREAFVEANKYWDDPSTGTRTLSPWYLDYKNNDPGAAEAKLEALRAIATDERLSQRDDIRGLLQYLDMRDGMQEKMARRGFRSLSTKQAFGLLNEWEERAHSLVESNLQFAEVWNRWLSNDDKLDIPRVRFPGDLVGSEVGYAG